MHGVSDFYMGRQIDGTRPYQEDYFACHIPENGDNEREVLLVLADGMGGHFGGAEASETAVSSFINHYEHANGDSATRLRECLDVANQSVRERAERANRFEDMGCTLVGCLISGDSVYWVSVGDSPLWLLENDALVRLNEDHSLRPFLEALVDAGRMTPEEFETDSRVHQLRSAVMGDELALVDQDRATVCAGQHLILASDGLETISEREISEICTVCDNPGDVVDALLRTVEGKRSPNQDNTTVMVYRHIPFSEFHQRSENMREAPTVPLWGVGQAQ